MLFYEELWAQNRIFPWHTSLEGDYKGFLTLVFFFLDDVPVFLKSSVSELHSFLFLAQLKVTTSSLQYSETDSLEE